MGVPGKLQLNSLLFNDRKGVRDVGEENAGAVGIELRIFENGLEAPRIRGIVEWNAEDLQAIEIDGFVVEDAKAGVLDGV
jgi:hypothetical protein